jgi:hypothetical protein
MPNWFDDNAPAPATTEAKNTPSGGDWFAQNAPVETPTEQPARFPQYSPVNAGIKRPDLGEQYREDTKAGPFTKPGAAEAATNVGTEGLKTAVLATAAGVTAGGTGLATGAVEAAPAVAGAVGASARWAIKNPIVAGLGYHIARELGIPLPKVLDVLSKFKE